MYKKSISFFAPAYNEEANIEKFVLTASAYLQKNFNDYEIIIVNDGSSDKTKEILEKISLSNSRLKIVNHKANNGYGSAIKSGIKTAKKDLIFFTDSDLQFDLTEIDLLLKWIKEYPIVIGYRKKRKDGLIRNLYAKSWSFLIKKLFKVKAKDFNCAFKLFRKEAIKDLELFSLGALINAELLAKLKKRNYDFKEVAVSHFPRKKGKQTGSNLKVIIKALKELFFLRRKILKG